MISVNEEYMIVLNSHVYWGLHEARGYEGCIHKAEEAK